MTHLHRQNSSKSC